MTAPPTGTDAGALHLAQHWAAPAVAERHRLAACAPRTRRADRVVSPCWDKAPPSGDFRGKVILPRQVAALIRKLIAKKSGEQLEAIIKPNANSKGEKEPADVYLVGDDWVFSCPEVEGEFPRTTRSSRAAIRASP